MNENETILYEDAKHKCVMFSFDDESHEDSFLSVNQFLIVQNGEGVLIDPGCEGIFDELYSAISSHIDPQKIKYIFLSHQDPDVAGSIMQWSISTSAKFVISALWVRFMSHYGLMDIARFMILPDRGAKLNFGKEYLKFVPAHFLHSPGNFTLYDSQSKIAFSGDIGAAIVTSIDSQKIVENFEEHKGEMEGFHKRYMASNKVCRAWVEKIRALDVEIIAPQHGFILKDKNVKLFLDWLSELECGSDLLDTLY